MELSTRNVIKGTVKTVDIGAVNAEVVVEIAPGIEITSIITKRSCERLKLKPGAQAYVLAKASDVMLATE